MSENKSMVAKWWKLFSHVAMSTAGKPVLQAFCNKFIITLSLTSQCCQGSQFSAIPRSVPGTDSDFQWFPDLSRGTPNVPNFHGTNSF